MMIFRHEYFEEISSRPQSLAIQRYSHIMQRQSCAAFSYCDGIAKRENIAMYIISSVNFFFIGGVHCFL